MSRLADAFGPVRRAWAALDRTGNVPLPKGVETVLKGFVVLLVVLVLVGLVGGIVPTRVREGARRIACRHTLDAIMVAAHLYAGDHDGLLPGTLGDLHPSYVSDPHCFSCPSSPSRYQDFTEGRATDESSSYTLVPGLREGMPADFILFCDTSRDNHSGDGRNVVFLDQRAEWWPVQREGEFQLRLAEQMEAMRNWKPAGEKDEGRRMKDE